MFIIELHPGQLILSVKEEKIQETKKWMLTIPQSEFKSISSTARQYVL